MTDQTNTTLTNLLNEIEAELTGLSLWESQPPPASAFESDTPFFADRMAFHQWIQWVFIARFRAIIEGKHAMPTQCQIAPMAEEALKEEGKDISALLELIRQFDAEFPD